MLAPIFNLTVIVNTVDGDAELNYHLQSRNPNEIVAEDEQDFSIQTVDQAGTYQAEVVVSDEGEINLTQGVMADWKMLEVYCTSSDPTVTSSLYSDSFGYGVKIAAKLYGSMTCTFTNVKVIPKKNPVIIIPGILSSYLNRNDDEKTELWPSIRKALFGLPGDKYLDELVLNQIGQPDLSYPVVLPTDIFRKINNNDFFDGLIQKLKAEGYEEGVDLFVFPYDWRLDIRQVVAGLYSPILTSLKDRIAQILIQTEGEKVDIIAHSMGGLLTKYYIKNYGEGKVGKFIDIATPHLGAPSALKTLMWGDDMGIKFGFLGLNTAEVKKVVENMPSVYQLLPSEKYFSAESPDYLYYIYNNKRLSYNETSDFLESSGRNSYILERAPNMHHDLDAMSPADFGVKAYNIVGCGVPTIAKFFNLGQENYDVSYTSGDGTVPEKSSRNFPVFQEYQVTNASHSVLPSREGVSDLISKILTDEVESYVWTDYEYVSTSTPVCNLPDGELISFHGPVRLDHYEYGTEMIYDYIDNNTFIFLPLISEEKVKVIATKPGRANAHVKKFRNNQVISTSYFNNIPLANASTTLEINLDSDIPQINDILPSITITGDSLADLDPPTTISKIVYDATSTIVQFISEDDDVLKTEYSIDNEQYTTGTSTTIAAIGTTTIYYHSVDNSGNIEENQEIEIYVIPPSISPVEEIIDTTSTRSGNSSPRKSKPNPSDLEEKARQWTEPVVAQKVGEVAEQETVLPTNFVKVEGGLLGKPEINDIAEETAIELLYPAAVLETGQATSVKYGKIIFIIVLILVGVILVRKLLKSRKCYNE